MRVYTIGHSTRSPEEFAGLLRRHGVEHLIDIRTFPRSRHVAWTNIEQLPGILARFGILHSHLPTLGGLRKPVAHSPNSGWRNASFQGYADHMLTWDFHRGIEELVAIGTVRPSAVMCAEAVPWRCHRSLVADALVVRGIEVLHILDDSLRPHKLTPFAKVQGTTLTYPPAGGLQTRLPGAEDEGAGAMDVEEA